MENQNNSLFKLNKKQELFNVYNNMLQKIHYQFQ